jgi:NAD(P)-dependent dehydrogenase (short-subunit alcohol dehydrogenase family)
LTGISSLAGSRFATAEKWRLDHLHIKFVGYTAGSRALRLTPRAKLGTIGLTQVLAAELGPKGTRVNAISPGGTDTRLARP